MLLDLYEFPLISVLSKGAVNGVQVESFKRVKGEERYGPGCCLTIGGLLEYCSLMVLLAGQAYAGDTDDKKPDD